MSELNVRITGDATKFNATLQQAKTQAAKFNQQLATDTAAAVSPASGGHDVKSGWKKFGKSGAKITKAAGSLGAFGDIAGVGKVAQGAAGVEGAMFGVQSAAAALGVSFGVAAGALAVFAGAIAAVVKLVTEYKATMKALVEQGETFARQLKMQEQVHSEYRAAILENKNLLGEKKTKELLKGIGSGNVGERNAAMAQVRSLIGGTVINKDLRDELVRAQIEAMPKGRDKDLAEENYRFRKSAQELREKTGDKPSQLTAALAREIFKNMAIEHQTKVSEINEAYNKLEMKRGERPSERPESQDVDSLTKMGLFTSSAMVQNPIVTLQQQQLKVQQEIARNTRPTWATANPFK
jgi:hypothetical protein